MTKGELSILRAEEKALERWMKFEKLKDKRIEQIKDKLNLILDVMTATVLVLTLIGAFIIDAFGVASIPFPVYAIAIGYLAIYVFLNYRRFTNYERRGI